MSQVSILVVVTAAMVSYSRDVASSIEDRGDI